MSLRERIDIDLKTARKEQNKEIVGFLRVLKGEIQRAESPSNPMSDGEITKVITKITKNLSQINTKESQIEMDFLNEYLPEPLTEDEIKSLIDDICLNFTDPLTMRDMGSIMSQFNEKYSGQADNRIVSQLVKSKINA